MSERRCTPGEGAEFGVHVAELAAAGLPLAPGLRALAAELRAGRMARRLSRLAQRLEAGEPLDRALDAEPGLPRSLRALVAAGLRHGRLTTALAEYADLERRRLELRRRVRRALVYPAVLMTFALAVLALFSGIIAPAIFDMHQSMGSWKSASWSLPDEALRVFVWALRYGAWNFVAVATVLAFAAAALRATGGLAPAQRVLDWIPLVGPIGRWEGWSQTARSMALLLEQGVPLGEAFRLTASGLRRVDLREACLGAAERAEAGEAAAEAVAGRLFPPGLRAVLARSPDAALGFRAAAEIYEGRTRTQLRVLETAAAPLALLLLGGFVLLVFLGLFVPLIRMLTLFA